MDAQPGCSGVGVHQGPNLNLHSLVVRLPTYAQRTSGSGANPERGQREAEAETKPGAESGPELLA